MSRELVWTLLDLVAALQALHEPKFRKDKRKFAPTITLHFEPCVLFLFCSHEPSAISLTEMFPRTLAPFLRWLPHPIFFLQICSIEHPAMIFPRTLCMNVFTCYEPFAISLKNTCALTDLSKTLSMQIFTVQMLIDFNLPSVDPTSRSHIHLSPERMCEEKITTKQPLRRKTVQSSTVHITPS